MRNRAKCKLCGSIIESLSLGDYVECSCGEIAVDAGPSLRCLARDWSNFMRVDDQDNEILITLKDGTPSVKPTKKELLDMLDEMGKSIERLPDYAMLNPATNNDLYSLILLISSIFRSAE